MKKVLLVIVFTFVYCSCERIMEPNQKNTSIIYILREGNSRYLYVMNIDGQNQRKLSDISNVQFESLSISPDNSKITFIASESVDQYRDVFIINNDGSHLTNLTASLNKEENPQFSQNGSMIVFESEVDDINQICRINVNGINLIYLTESAINKKLLDISTDNKILFSTYDSSKANLYTMYLDGSDLTNLDFTQSPIIYEAKFSSDGEQIVFSKQSDDHIWIMSSDGSVKSKLTEGSEPQFFLNNKKILYEIPYNYGIEFYSIDSDGSNMINLTNSQSINVNPDILSDGSKIVFQSFRDGNSEIYTMNGDGRDQKRLTSDLNYNSNPLFIEIFE